jgi:hypothetical protein
MNDLIAKLKQPSLWTVSVQLLILYVVSVAIFFAANAVHKKAETALNERVAKGDAGSSAGLFLLAAALNFLCVLALIFVTAKTGEHVRMSMVLLPLFLIIEQHVRQLRSHPHERRAQLIGIAGVTIGIGAAVAALMPHAPLK